MLKYLQKMALLFGVSLLLVFAIAQQAKANDITCSQSTLDAFATSNQSVPDTAGIVVMSESSGDCMAKEYTRSWESCISWNFEVTDHISAVALCVDWGPYKTYNRSICFTRGDGPDITSVTLYKGTGTTSGENVPRSTWPCLNTSTDYRVTYDHKHEGRRWFEFRTNASGSGVIHSSITIRTDNTRPKIIVTDLPTSVTSTGSFTATYLANEDVLGFDLADIQAGLTNAMASDFTTVIENRKFTVTITPTGTSDITLSVPEGVATDKADNINTIEFPVTVKIDDNPPVVTIEGVPSTGTAGTPFTAYYYFTDTGGAPEPVTGFDLDDINDALTNAVATDLVQEPVGGPYHRFYATITPDGNGNVVVGVNADAATNISDVGNAAATPQVATVPDTKAPIVTSVIPSSTTVGSSGTLEIDIVFSEGMDTSQTPTLTFSPDVSAALQDATAQIGTWTSTTITNDTYKVVYALSNSGSDIDNVDVTVGTEFRDEAGNPLESPHTEADVFSVVADETPPTAPDERAPSVTISAPAEARGPFTATFTFSEDVTGFDDVNDITVSNSTIANLSIGTITSNGEEVFTATVTPIEHGPVTIDVPADIAEDGAGNLNTAADQVTVSYIDNNHVRERTSHIISNFTTRRGNAIVSNQTDLTERLNQAGSGSSGTGASFTGEGSYANNRLDFATNLRQILAANKANKYQRIAELSAGLGGDRKEGSQNGLKIGGQHGGMQNLGFRNLSANDSLLSSFDIWVKGRWARYDATSDGQVGLFFIGADYKFNDDIVVGVMAQFDWTNEADDIEDFAIEGRGWMIGPYLVARLHQNLIFDANFSWGQSDNEVSPFNTYTDSFDGQRWLAAAKFTGSFKFSYLHIAPHIGVQYFQERQKAYVDSLSIDIPDQTVRLGRLSFGPRFSTEIKRNDGTIIKPYLGIKGLWDFDRTAIVDLTTGLAAESTDEFRARINAGLKVRLADGMALKGEGFYDGLGAEDYESYGGSIRLNIPLQRDSNSSEAMKLGVGLAQSVRPSPLQPGPLQPGPLQPSPLDTGPFSQKAPPVGHLQTKTSVTGLGE